MARDTYSSGGGKVYYRPRNQDGTYGKRLYFGRTSAITLTANVDYKDAYNTEGKTQLLGKRLPSKTDVSAKWESDQIDVDVLTIALKADKITIAQTAQTGVTATLSAVEPGSFEELGYYNVSNVVVKDAADTTTYVEGTDYAVRSNVGWIEILEGGAISQGDDLHVTFDVPDYTATGLAGFKTSSLEGRFEVVQDTDTGNDYMWVFKRLSVAMDGDFSLKNPDEFATISFMGSAMIDTETVTGTWSDYVDVIPIDAA